MKRVILLLVIILLSMGIYFVGCNFSDPVDTKEADQPIGFRTFLSEAEFSKVLVPDSDVPATGWVPYPISPWSRYDKIDEGVDSLSLSDFIYTFFASTWDRFTFTNITGYNDIDVSEIEFTIPLNAYDAEALLIQLHFYYYIDGNQEGYAVFECGEAGSVACDDSTWVVTFSDVCYDLDEINSLEVKINSTGAQWDAGNSALTVYAIDADAKFDTVCTPEIESLDSERDGNTVTVTWDTDCESTSKVIWGYSAGSLTNTATGSDGTEHSVDFTVGSTEGCVYFKAISAGLTCSSPADTSETQTDVKDVVISSVVRTFNPVACTMTVTWTTNVKSSSKVYWGSSCGSLTNTATGAGNTTSHSVTWDVTGVPARSRVYSKAESASGCDTEQSSCNFIVRNSCIM